MPRAVPRLAIRLVVALRRGLQRLADALSPAELVLFDELFGMTRTQAIAAVVRAGIPDILGRQELNATQIAAPTRLDADVVHRTLRALASVGIFSMNRRGGFRNNRISRALMSGSLARGREWALYFGSPSNVAAWSAFGASLEDGRSAFKRVHGVSVWEWFEQHPDEREIFAHMMLGRTLHDAPAIAELYPFSEVRRLCDVGGGRGTLLSEILVRHGGVRGVLADAPSVLASARELLEQRGVLERVELAPGNFFVAVPADCDAYLLKNILHDWDDATCVRIFDVVRRAAAPGARLIVCETLLEHASRDSIGSFADLHMLVACEGGRERSRDELEKLMRRGGFVLRRVFSYPTVSVLEAVRG